MTDELERFVEGTQDRAGHPDRGPVQHAVRTTLRALGSHLGGVPPVLHDAIPRGLHPHLTAGERLEPGPPEAVYQRVAEQTGLRVGVALELVQSAVAELAEGLAEPAREHLRAQLPSGWSVLVVDPRPRSQVPSAPSAAGSGYTLASGRPGPREEERTLAKGRPGSRHSVAGSD